MNSSTAAGSEFYGAQLLGLDRPVHLLRRSHGRRRPQRRRPREPRAQDPVPAPGDPVVGRPAGVVQPRPESDRGARSSRSSKVSRPMLSWLELPLIVAFLAVFTTGIAMLLSALFVHFRDVQPIWDVLPQVLFYASPVIISVETVKEKLERDAAARLHAQPARGRLPAVPPRDGHARDAQRRGGCWRLGRAARSRLDRRRRRSRSASACSTARRR